jgi:indolepyruvate ferredoxin oxidoreductase beta subunit
MPDAKLTIDPYNVIITGVGGQGNVMASRVMGGMLSRKGFNVTIGETFGASQRGGSVMSHLRISTVSSWSPQIPKSMCHLIVSLEPTEAIRVLKDYGNPNISVLCNTRPIHSIGVISGAQAYPELPDIKSWVTELSATAGFIDATDRALEMGDPIYGNIMMIGAVAGMGVLPLDRQDFKAVIAGMVAPAKVAVNLSAYDLGREMVEGAKD